MKQKIQVKLTPQEAFENNALTNAIAAVLGTPKEHITGYIINKQSIDARSRLQIWVNLSLEVSINEPFHQRNSSIFNFPILPKNAPQIIIVGAGPAGLFAALECIEKGIRPIVIERGKNIRDRRRDLAQLNKLGEVNADSNYCFGEGLSLIHI